MLKVSIFISDSKTQIFSVSTSPKGNYFKLAEGLNNSSGLGGAAVSIGACGASDSSANLDPDLSSFFFLLKEKGSTFLEAF